MTNYQGFNFNFNQLAESLSKVRPLDVDETMKLRVKVEMHISWNRQQGKIDLPVKKTI